MSEIRDELKYTDDHEWTRIEEGTAVIGITDHAQAELGDIVFVELPEIGDTLEKGESFGTIEAVKTVAELYAPLGGEVLDVNDSLADEAEVINSDPYGKGWIVKVRLENKVDAEALMDASAYKAHIG